MAKKTRPELLDSTAAFEEELHGDNELSDEERAMQDKVEEALEQGRIPSECIEYIPIADSYYAKVVIYKDV